MFQSGRPVLASMRDQMRIQRAHVERVAQHRDAAIVRAAADVGIRARRVAVKPEQPAGLGIDRHHVVGPLGDIHDAIDDQRVGFPGAEHLVLHHPFLFEISDIRGRDLIQRAEALAVIAAVVGEPVLRLGGGAQDAIRGDLRRAGSVAAASAASSATLAHERFAHRYPLNEIR